MGTAEPDGAVKCVGASASSRRRNLQGSKLCRACAKSSLASSPSAVLPANARASGIKDDLVAALDAIGELRLDLGERQRRRQHDASLRGGSGDLSDGEERRARKRGGRIDIGATAVGEEESTAGAAVLGDAVGISERKERADR